MYWINPAFSPTSGSVNSFTLRVVCPMVWCSNRRCPSPFCLPSVIHLPTRGNQPTDSGQFRTPGQGYSSVGTEALWDGTPTCCRPKDTFWKWSFLPFSAADGVRSLKTGDRTSWPRQTCNLVPHLLTVPARWNAHVLQPWLRTPHPQCLPCAVSSSARENLDMM